MEEKKMFLEGEILKKTLSAGIFRWLSLSFERPREEWRKEINNVSLELKKAGFKQDLTDHYWPNEGEYLQHFGPGGYISLREISHCGQRDPGDILSEISQFYEAFGFKPSREDPVDHLSVELNFVSFLELKIAFALWNKNSNEAEIAEEALNSFLKKHLTEFSTKVIGKLNGKPYAEYLKPALDSLLNIINNFERK